MIRRQFLAALAVCLVEAGRCIASAAPAGFRAAVDHTHTCAAGHVWDHTKNPGHVCQEIGAGGKACGRTPPLNRSGRYIIDSPTKWVPVPVAHVGHNPLPR